MSSVAIWETAAWAHPGPTGGLAQREGNQLAVNSRPALRQTVQDSDYYEVVYDGPGATIARPRD